MCVFNYLCDIKICSLHSLHLALQMTHAGCAGRELRRTHGVRQQVRPLHPRLVSEVLHITWTEKKVVDFSESLLTAVYIHIL